MDTVAIRTDSQKMKRVARLMKTVGHPARLAIVELLLEQGRLTVKDIYEEINISQSNASQHLKALEDLGVLLSEREGKNIYYAIGALPIDKLIQCVRECADC